MKPSAIRRAYAYHRQMRTKVGVSLAAGSVTFLILLATATVMGLADALPFAAAGSTIVTLALWRPGRRSPAVWLAAAPALASLGTTITTLLSDKRQEFYGVAEVILLCMLLAGITRWASGPPAIATGALTATAAMVWLLRFIPNENVSSIVAGLGVWSVPIAVAAGIGAYPRLAARRLRRSVEAARQEQRASLERDLHDYVAHDLTGMIVQAQSARYAAGDDLEKMRDALRQIEESGHRAMASMDRALDLLGDEAAAARQVRRPGLDELDRLVSDFAESSPGDVDLVERGDLTRVPQEVSETLYGIAVEALTNVRRHAPDATSVTVALDIGARHAQLVVTNSARPIRGLRRIERHGGRGLPNAAARVEALGGHFAAGPSTRGWVTDAHVPIGRLADPSAPPTAAD